MLLVEMRAQRFELAHGKVRSLVCVPVKPNGALVSQGIATTVTAEHFVLAAGAINSPAVLLRSEAPDPHGRLGLRTFLHPVVMSAAVMPAKVEGWQGAPQSIYTDHFLETQPLDGASGFMLEAPPVHPVIFAPLTDFVMDGARRALLAMAEIQFSAGASQVLPVHELASPYTSWAGARQAIQALPMKPLLTKGVSAHVMGGCGAAGNEKIGVTRPDAVHWQLENLSIHDGSIFPTSIGANPQLSIYGIVNRMAQGLAKRLSGKDVILA